MATDTRNAGQRLQDAAATYIERNKVYGDSYKMHGDLLTALFPEGLDLVTKEDHNRFGVLTIMLSKLNRYCNNFSKGGHQDSIHDLGVYSFMLEELDAEAEAELDVRPGGIVMVPKKEISSFFAKPPCTDGSETKGAKS